jgi:hypothetical protein
LSFLAKWPPLFALDIRDEWNRPLPLLTLGANGIVDAAALVELARRVLNRSRNEMPAQLVKDLEDIAAGPPPEAHRAFERVFRPGSLVADRADRDALGDNARFLDIALSLVTNTILWLPLLSEPGRRRIVKLAYDVDQKRGLALWRAWFVNFGWLPAAYLISTPHVGGAGSYHLDISALPDWEIIDAELVAVERTPILSALRASNAQTTLPYGHSVRKAHKQVAASRAHLYLTGTRMGSLSAGWVSTRVQRRGFLTASFAAASTVAVLLVAFRLWPEQVFDHDPAGPVAVLLIAPAVLAAFLARPVASGPGSSVLRGVRALVAGSGITAVVSAFALIAWVESTAKQVWLIGACVAGGIAVLLLASLAFPRRVPRSRS